MDDLPSTLDPVVDDYLNLNTDQARVLRNQCNTKILTLKQNITREYDKIKLSLENMRTWKRELIEAREERNYYSTILAIDHSQSASHFSSHYDTLDRKLPPTPKAAAKPAAHKSGTTPKSIPKPIPKPIIPAEELPELSYSILNSEASTPPPPPDQWPPDGSEDAEHRPDGSEDAEHRPEHEEDYVNETKDEDHDEPAEKEIPISQRANTPPLPIQPKSSPHIKSSKTTIKKKPHHSPSLSQPYQLPNQKSKASNPKPLSRLAQPQPSHPQPRPSQPQPLPSRPKRTSDLAQTQPIRNSTKPKK